MVAEHDEDRFLTIREAEILIANTAESLRMVVAFDKEQNDLHNAAHDDAHRAHAEKHGAEAKAVETALAAVARERQIHADAHIKEHEGHQREHGLNNLAIDKAEAATDKRFSTTNAYREQINDMVRSLASRDAVDVLVKDVDRRFEESRKDRERRHEELRQAIANLERTDVKAEGKGIGQSAIIAYIVTAFGLIATVLAIVVVIANVLTAVPV